MFTLNWLLVIIGEILVAIGIFCDLMGSIGMHRFKNFYLRLHAATVGTIGGAFVPLIGASLIAVGSEFLGYYRWFMAGGALVTAILILILAPAGTHALARATHKARVTPVEPKIADHLEEDEAAKESER